MAQSPHACLHGTTVQLSGKSGPFRLCPHDGGSVGTVNLIAGNPHHAQVICASCQMHVSWLSAAHLDAMAAQGRAA